MAVTQSLYPWYGVVTGSDLEQGDILVNCPLLVIPPEALRAPAQHPIIVQRQSAIVMTQSCDLAIRANGSCAIDEAILLPFYSRAELSTHKIYGNPQGWEEARKGRHAGYHVLNRDRKSTRLNSSHIQKSRMPSSA